MAYKPGSAFARHEERVAWLFIAPWVLGFIIFEIGPMVFSLALSLFRWDGLTSPNYVGAGNYATLLIGDADFWQALRVTVLYACMSIPLGIVLGVGVSLLLNTKVKGLSVWRTIYFLPAVVGGVAVSVLWVGLLNPDYGVLNKFLRVIGLSNPPHWLSSSTWALPALVLMGLWSVGGSMVLYLAGLQGVPTQLYEAAAIDGAGRWRRFWHVTLPMLSPVIFFNVIMGLISSFQVFTQARVMTNGGPNNATLFYALDLYNNSFRYFKLGYASAQAWILFGIILVLTLVVMRGSRRFVYYESGPEGR
jgi:multiple sugar transport system permease protein